MSRFASIVAFAALSSVASAVASTFDQGDEGWRTCNFNFGTSVASSFDVPEYVATGGAPGGYVSTPDVDFWCFFAAPQKFLGGDSSAFGTTLSFDTKVDRSDGSVYPTVVLQGAGLTIYSVSNAPSADWTHVSIPLVGSSWMLSTLDASGNPIVDGAPLGDLQLKSVLGNLTGLYLEADWDGTSSDETTDLDNVRLDVSPVPEPAALLPLALGTFALARRPKGR